MATQREHKRLVDRAQHFPIDDISDEEIAKDIEKLQSLERLVGEDAEKNRGLEDEPADRAVAKADKEARERNSGPYTDFRFAETNREVKDLTNDLVSESYQKPGNFDDRVEHYKALNPNFRSRHHKNGKKHGWALKDFEDKPSSVRNLENLDGKNVGGFPSKSNGHAGHEKGGNHRGNSDLNEKDPSLISGTLLTKAVLLRGNSSPENSNEKEPLRKPYVNEETGEKPIAELYQEHRRRNDEGRSMIDQAREMSEKQAQLAEKGGDRNSKKKGKRKPNNPARRKGRKQKASKRKYRGQRREKENEQEDPWEVEDLMGGEESQDVDESKLMTDMTQAERRYHDNDTVFDIVDQGQDRVALNVTHSSFGKKVHGHRDIVIAGCVVSGVGVLLILIAIFNLLFNKKRFGMGRGVNKNNSKFYQRLGKSEGEARLRHQHYSLFPESSEESDSDETVYEAYTPYR